MTDQKEVLRLRKKEYTCVPPIPMQDHPTPEFELAVSKAIILSLKSRKLLTQSQAEACIERLTLCYRIGA